jgi:hypothetical protein
MVELIAKWRKEMNNIKIPQKPNIELLQKAITDLKKAGLSEGLVAYYILNCEYLFRVKFSDKKDAENLLLEIETHLHRVLSERAAYHVVKAIERSIKKTIKDEGRRPIVFNTTLAPPLWNWNQRASAIVQDSQIDESRSNRIALGELAPRKSGRLFWIAPWVVGSIVKQRLSEIGKPSFKLALNLVGALFNEKTQDEADFRKRDKTLRGQYLTNLINNYSDAYDKKIEVEKNRAPFNHPKKFTWEDLIFFDWEPPLGLEIYKNNMIYPNHEIVYGLLKSYNTSGRKKTLKKWRKK